MRPKNFHFLENWRKHHLKCFFLKLEYIFFENTRVSSQVYEQYNICCIRRLVIAGAVQTFLRFAPIGNISGWNGLYEHGSNRILPVSLESKCHWGLDHSGQKWCSRVSSSWCFPVFHILHPLSLSVM